MDKAKNLFNSKALSLAVSVAVLGLGAAGVVRAEVYGIAADQLTTFQVIAATPGSLTTSGGSRTSAGSATFNGTGPATSDVVVPPGAADAQPATAGPGPFAANNTNYNQTTAPLPLGTIGSFGDSQVFGNAFGAGSTAEAVAQSRIIGNGSASSEGRDALSTNLIISATTRITVSFFDDPNLQAFSDVVGGTARASETARFSIVDINNVMGGGINSLVFDFAPNGITTAGGANNTTETLDPFSLNQQISSIGTQGLVNVNDAVTTNPGSSQYNAFTTIDLTPGTYRFDALIQKNVSVNQLNVIPEPASLLLSALGLMALGFTTRRKAG